jgi:hypothetical protein
MTYKVPVRGENENVYFTSLDAASRFCNDVAKRTGVILTIIEVCDQCRQSESRVLTTHSCGHALCQHCCCPGLPRHQNKHVCHCDEEDQDFTTGFDERLVLYECGICDCLHPWNFNGDCRDDNNRFADANEYAKKIGRPEIDIRVRSMDERISADESI